MGKKLLLQLDPQGRPGRRHHTRLCGNIGPLHLAFARQGVAGVRHGGHGVVVQRLGFQVRRGVARLQAAHKQVQLAQAQLGQQAGQVALVNQHRGAAGAGLEPLYRWRQQHGRGGHHGAHAGAANGAAGFGGNLVARAIKPRQHRAGKAHHAGPRRCGLGATGRSLKQRQAEHRLDFGQGFGDRWLRDRQEFGCPAQVPELVQRHQHLQVAQLEVAAQYAVNLCHGAQPCACLSS